MMRLKGAEGSNWSCESATVRAFLVGKGVTYSFTKKKSGGIRVSIGSGWPGINII